MNADALPDFMQLKQKPPKITVDRRDDGSVLISSDYPLEEVRPSMVHLFELRASEFPDRNFIGRRVDGGDWKFVTYGEAKTQSDAVAQAMLNRGMGPDTPLMVLSSNSIEHGIMALGALKAGVPVAPISVPYSIMSQDHAKLKHVFKVTQPKMIFADLGALYSPAINDLPLDGVEIVTCDGAGDGFDQTLYSDLLTTNVSADVAASIDKINHDTVAKYLFTSGSTGMPKGVIQTHRMWCSLVAGQRALATEEIDLNDPAQTLEWMPWNHVSAGNISFGGVLEAGSTLYLDDGKPIPGMFDETMRNLKEVAPKVFGSAPIAFTMLADAMEQDEDLRRNFFSKLEAMGYGGATLSSDIYDRMQALAIAETGQRMPFTTMYGATETQGITVVHWLTERVGLIGLPLPGITIKLVPNGTKMEVRVKGPTVTPGYLNDPEKSKEAFDEEGFYKLGDAAKFLDDDRPEEGLVFDGRVTEDFKLDSGTWVSVGTVRPDLVAATTPYVTDAVITGLDKPYIGALVWPNIPACQSLVEDGASLSVDELITHPVVRDTIAKGVADHNAAGGGSSTRVRKVLLMAEPPSVDGHEITDKGYVNQAATLDRRADLAAKLYEDPVPSEVIEV